MSDLGTSNAVRGSKMASQHKMKIEKVVSCDKKFCPGYRLRGFWEVPDIWIHFYGRSELVRFERLYRFFIWFTYRWDDSHKSRKWCWAYHGIFCPSMSTISIMGNLLLFESSWPLRVKRILLWKVTIKYYLSIYLWASFEVMRSTWNFGSNH